MKLILVHYAMKTKQKTTDICLQSKDILGLIEIKLHKKMNVLCLLCAKWKNYA